MSTARELVVARAPAKVNLSLAVLGKRPDGYHELDTRMLALELADRLVLRRRAERGIELTLAGPFASADIPADASNLAARAAAEALALAGAEGGIALELTKEIPSGSGLGGGSSDAAAAWIGACALLGLEPPEAASQAVLAALGSDCVFFWKAATTGYARCLGRGERVQTERAPAGVRCVALLVPAVACPTAKVYAAYRAGSGTSRNALEPAALAAIPELAKWRKGLDSCRGTHWQLSGSGSAFFAPHAQLEAARADLGRVQAALPGLGLVPRLSLVSAASGRGAEILG